MEIPSFLRQYFQGLMAPKDATIRILISEIIVIFLLPVHHDHRICTWQRFAVY